MSRFPTIRTSLIVLAALIVAGFLFNPPRCHAGMSPLQALSLSAGAQARWLDTPNLTSQPDMEAVGNASMTLTPHVDVTGGVAIGLGGSYVREQIDARITATDVTDQTFSVWVGGGYYWSEQFDDGLSGWAAKAGIGWQPSARYPIVLGATAAGTPGDGRSSISLSATWLLKKGGQR